MKKVCVSTMCRAMVLALCLSFCALRPSAFAAEDAVYYISFYAAEDLTVLPPDAVGVSTPVRTEPGAYAYILPEGPARPGFTFTGWKLEGGGTLHAPGENFQVTQDSRFYAQWTAAHPFTDLKEGTDYFYDVIQLWSQGVMTGTSPTAFSPEGGFTRAMLWTVLARLADAPTGGTPWYAQAQSWAVENGVSDGSGPARAVSRQELVTMLYRQAGSPEVQQGAEAALAEFPGGEDVASWAREAMWWAVQTKVLYDPQGSGVLAPERAVTRCEVAVSVARTLALTQGGEEK